MVGKLLKHGNPKCNDFTWQKCIFWFCNSLGQTVQVVWGAFLHVDKDPGQVASKRLVFSQLEVGKHGEAWVGSRYRQAWKLSKNFLHCDCPPKSRLYFFFLSSWPTFFSGEDSFSSLLWMQNFKLILLISYRYILGDYLICIIYIYFRGITKTAAVIGLSSIMGNRAFYHTWIFEYKKLYSPCCQNIIFSGIFQRKISKICSFYCFKHS